MPNMTHHWKVSDPTYESKNGDFDTLTEVTQWACKHCGQTRENRIDIPVFDDGNVDVEEDLVL